MGIDALTLAKRYTDKQLRGKSNYRAGVVSIIDDDNPDTFITRWKPIADAQGIKLSIAVNTSYVGASGKMTLAQLKTLKAAGHDILSHGYTHPDMNTMSLADLENEWNLSKQYLIANGLGDDLGLVYTTGLGSIADAQKIIDVKALTRKYYKYGIDAIYGATGINTLPVDNYDVLRMFITPATVVLADIKAYIDDAYANGKWLILLTHCGISWDDANTPTNLNAIIDYIQGLGMPILNFRDAEKLIGNVISQGDSRTNNYNFVAKNGASLSSEVGKMSKEMIVSSMDALKTEYPLNKVTTQVLTSVQDTFLSRGGRMSVYRGDSAFTYAEFFPVQTTDIYRRYYLEVTTSWSPWVLVNNRPITQSTTMDAAISAYSLTQMSIFEIGSANDTFLSVGGKMCVFVWNVWAAFALFFPNNGTNDMYKREWNNSGATWGAWKRVNSGDAFTTANRPTNRTAGYTCFDTTLGKPIWLKTAPSTWVDATGTGV